ncbi:hypothetical protein ANANG_G00195170 [Anguilla anguilla]|uniref:Uncharacterized protein n=1 Tax=Anguilla anguilla TaxID=7936 RepID=A0A9D3RSB0_ANGAN|nr:hypothetical protein ANANG_G00195170 [Anguilla anguilla]
MPRRAACQLTDVQPLVECPRTVLNPFRPPTGDGVAGTQEQLQQWTGTWGRNRGAEVWHGADVEHPGGHERTRGVLCCYGLR